MARVTVKDYERVVRMVDGRVRDVLGPGRHRYRRRRTILHRVDVRPRLVTVPGQEVLTADGIAVRLTVVLRVGVVDPVAHLTSAQNANDELYTAVQLVLRDAVAGRPLDALLAARSALGGELVEPVRATGQRLGLDVAEVTVRDVMLPGDLRRAYAEVLLAQQRGRAELERARSEAAALRTLANAARLLDDHPALLRLRTLQAAEAPGTTLVVKQA
jgi:regulator of protease activity HflC (stomatin/prohibitin superfamily)